MKESIYADMEDSEKQVAELLKMLDLWWWYEFPVFIYDEKKRPRVWTPDFYILQRKEEMEELFSEKDNGDRGEKAQRSYEDASWAAILAAPMGYLA